jgi:MinD-like ATPase involved in chromosome partitioning or flagellar assembly
VLAKARERWMLRAQARPASAPADDVPAPAEPSPVPAGPSRAPTGPSPEPLATMTAASDAPSREAQASQAEAPIPEPPAPEPDTPEAQAPEAQAPEIQAPPIAPRIVGVERERERPLPSIERALSGPGSRDEVSWRRQVKVVAGGQGPGRRDQEALDRDRARLPLAGSYRIVVLGCTQGAGQTVTALMTGHILAAVRGVPVAALDLNPGPTSLAGRRPSGLSVPALLAGQEAEQQPAQDVRLDVIASLPGNGAPGNGEPGNGNGGGHPPDGGDFRRLADILAERYPLTMIDPAPSGLTRVLARADQLVLVAPASPDAATSLANTQQWLGAHGYGELAARAVTVVNGVSRRTKDDVLRAESVARGRCRAIVRVPWDDLLSSRQVSPQQATPQTMQPQTMQPQTRLAYTALAGVLISGLAATNTPNAVPGRNPGEHAD